MNTSAIETARLLLRRFGKEDIDAFFDIFSDPELNTYLPWFPLKNKEEAMPFMEEQHLSKYRQPQSCHYAICLKTDNRPIGYVQIKMDESYELGYGLKREWRHQGIVSEACRAVLELAKQEHIPFVSAAHDRTNRPSGQVMKRLGMIYRYSYAEHWQPKNKLVVFRMYQLDLNDSVNRTHEKYKEQALAWFVETEI